MRTRGCHGPGRPYLLALCGLVLSLASASAAEPDFAQSPQSDVPAAAMAEPQGMLIGAVRHRAAALASGDGAALAAFYAERAEPMWVTAEGFTATARTAMAEIARADEWGLAGARIELPRQDVATSPSALADAEVRLSLAVLSYARFARGGRVDLANFSRNVDQQLSLREPKAVLEGIAASGAPDAYLQGLHPTHPQFLMLRQALLRLRAGQGAAARATPEAVVLPDGPVLRPGMSHPDVALLRRRLRVAEGAGPQALYDPQLAEAVIAFQRTHKLPPDGLVGGRMRAALNGGQEKALQPFADAEQRLLLNMERWRWMPEDLGGFHVWNNVPEFVSRVVRHGVVIHSAKIVAGKPDTQTVLFSADMRYIVFHPEWGVPDSIKVKEILPYLRPSSGDFFGLFGGADTRILERHNLKVSYNGRPVDASQVDWNAVDVRRYSFIQPAGAGNVLGVVKFRFPNRHDIYMHDTPQRELFDKATRAFSHGCIRVAQPERLAELLLAEDKGWPAEHVRRLLAEGYNNEVPLEHAIPVHVTYFTAVAGDDGNVAYFGDVYGLDRRLAAALAGQPLPLEAAPVEQSVREARGGAGRGNKPSGGDFISGISGLFGN